MGAAFIAAWASAILESVPFVLGAAVIAHLPWPRLSRAAAYLDCGCGAGPSARSLPGAAATMLAFGFMPAVLRFGAALVVARRLRPAHCIASPAPLNALCALLPPAFFAALLHLYAAQLFGAHLPVAANAAIGATIAFVVAPCALAAPALAAALRTWSPAAALSFLCIAGICDLRALALRTGSHHTASHDCLSYVLLLTACLIATLRNGAQLVNPVLASGFAFSALASAYLAMRHRHAQSPRLRAAPALLLAALFLNAAPPAYHATETTLADAFAGERIDFTGAVVRQHGATALVRYAIVCCRADAAPVVIRLEKASPAAHGWVHAAGELVQTADGFALRVRRLSNVAAPADPFVYR